MGCGSSYTKPQLIQLGLLLSAAFFYGAIVVLPAPFLPLLNEQHGFASDITGWMISVYAMMYMVLSPFISKLNAKLGLYNMACSGTLILGINTIAFGLLDYIPKSAHQNDNARWAYVISAFMMRIFQGIGCSIIMNTSMTMNSLAFPEQTVAVLGYIETMLSVGSMSGPAMASGLFKLGGFMLVFSGFGGVTVLISILMFLFLPRTLQLEDQSPDQRVGLMSLLKRPRLTGSLIMIIYGGIITAAWEPVLEPELRKKFGLSPEISSLCFILIGAAYAIVMPVAAKLINNGYCIDGVLLMSVGAGVATVTYLLAGPTPLFSSMFERPLWLLLCSIVCLGIATSLLVVATLGEIYAENEDGSTETNSMISGLWASCFMFGSFIGPVISGMLAEATNFAWATTFLAGTSLFFLLISLVLYCLIKGLVKDCYLYCSEKCRTCPVSSWRGERSSYESL